MTLLGEKLESSRNLIDELLAEQQRLTAVERFARKHERSDFPAQARYYRSLIPLTKPGRGEQYAFAVDLDACTGCKACVSACHSLNGLDEDETWRNIGLLHGGTTEAPYQQTVTTACHHCVEPACLLGCPVMAYEKDRDTGIVRHLDDQCIGCQYCVLKCPYDVPKYSEERGIVRKCDMCHGRLGSGEAPACVQACPSGAIAIRIVQTAVVETRSQPGHEVLPGAFDSSYTKPTTAFHSRRPIPENARPGDSAALRLEHAHWPLIWMLVLTQAAAGMLVCAVAPPLREAAIVSVVATILLNVGLAVSVLHLGRPLGAWRAFLGLRTSWMSREILGFGVFAGAAAISAMGQVIAVEWFSPVAGVAMVAGVATAALGMAAVFCSAMIYIDTRRAFWRARSTFPKFFGAVLLLGCAGAAACLAFRHDAEWARGFAAAGLILQVALLAWEARCFRRDLLDLEEADHRSALVMWTLQRPLLLARAAIAVTAVGVEWRTATSVGNGLIPLAVLGFLLLFTAQVLERYFFFTAVVAPRMPGPLLPQKPPLA